MTKYPKPGRALDELAAERVMGWEAVRYGDGGQFPKGSLLWWRRPRNINIDSFHPSRKIADAWLLIERMIELRWRLVIGYEPDKFCCGFHRPGRVSEDIDFGVIVKTAPHAITLAALKALRALPCN